MDPSSRVPPPVFVAPPPLTRRPPPPTRIPPSVFVPPPPLTRTTATASGAPTPPPFPPPLPTRSPAKVSGAPTPLPQFPVPPPLPPRTTSSSSSVSGAGALTVPAKMPTPTRTPPTPSRTPPIAVKRPPATSETLTSSEIQETATRLLQKFVEARNNLDIAAADYLRTHVVPPSKQEVMRAPVKNSAIDVPEFVWDDPNLKILALKKISTEGHLKKFKEDHNLL